MVAGGETPAMDTAENTESRRRCSGNGSDGSVYSTRVGVPSPLNDGIRVSSAQQSTRLSGDEHGVKRTTSMPQSIDMATQRPEVEPTPPTPLPLAKAGKTTQLPAGRTPRASEEFDRRYDGPFGRPSRNIPIHGAPHAGKRSLSRRRSAERAIRAEPEKQGNPPDGVAGVVSSSGNDAIFMPHPPRLNYTLHTRKMSIFLWWTVIVFDSVAMPIALYFGLWYSVGPGTNTATEINEKLSANAVFSIVTAAIGGASIFEYFLRFWRLWKDDSTCRVIGGGKWHLDWFHWNFTLAWLIVMVELIVGSVPDDPHMRLLSTPLTTMLYVFGTELLVVDILRYFRIPAPIRISSIPKGAQLRPGIYSLIEDICAVDGSGGTAYREALDRRYEASHIFRAMLRSLGVFWAVGAQATAVMCTILIFTLSKDAAYSTGWSVPFVWAGIWTVCTIWYVKRELKHEERMWAQDAGKGAA